MRRSISLTFRPFLAGLVLAAGTLNGSSAQAQAAEAVQAPQSPEAAGLRPMPQALGDRIGLSEAERDAILDANASGPGSAGLGDLRGPGLFGRGIHGEIGVMVGTNGTRGAYGTADIPLGENAGATLSFESSRFGGYRRRR